MHAQDTRPAEAEWRESAGRAKTIWDRYVGGNIDTLARDLAAASVAMPPASLGQTLRPKGRKPRQSADLLAALAKVLTRRLSARRPDLSPAHLEEVLKTHILVGTPSPFEEAPEVDLNMARGKALSPALWSFDLWTPGQSGETIVREFAPVLGLEVAGFVGDLSRDAIEATVYSCPADGSMHAVTLDIDEIGQGNYTDAAGDIVIPKAAPAKLPGFVNDHVTAQFPGGKLDHGTVVVIEKLDKITRNTVNVLRNQLLEFFGITYQKLLRNAEIVVDDTPLEPIDPLFITPGFRYYDIDADRAQALDPITIEVKGEDGKEVKGAMEVRFAYMPATFGSIDKTKNASDRKNQNPRFQIMKEYNGIHFYRMGRFLDCVRHTPFHTFVNNDRYFKIEVDFPAVLDEYFNVSTSKQRVDVSDKIWEKLKEAGLVKAIRALTGKYRTEKKESDAKSDTVGADGKRASEEAMEETAKVVRAPSPEIRQRQEQRGEAQLKKTAEKRAAETGQPVGKVEEQLRLELQGHPYKLGHENVPGAPFFRVDQLGGSTILLLNTAHRFYTELYMGADTSRAMRAAIEVLLFSIGDCINGAPEQVRAMYDLELVEWSKRLDYALLQLTQRVAYDDGEVGDATAEAA
jgi:hypothetical protein